MAHKESKQEILAYCQRQAKPLTLAEIAKGTDTKVPARTMRRWFAEWINNNSMRRFGNQRSTRYLAVKRDHKPRFLEEIAAYRRPAVLNQLRDLWTHNSTAIEGNTLSLGDTHFILEEGLTISGKPLKEHQEVIGHANAIEIIYRALDTPLDEQLLFDLHKAVQSEQIFDIDKPIGGWKVEPNGTYTVTRTNQSVYIEYAPPAAVPILMAKLIETINALPSIRKEQAATVYAKIHAGLVHIHPFWDGNGRIARLIANLPLLKSGLPPLIISVQQRKRYIQLLAEYELNAGQLNTNTGVWPNETLLSDFSDFCETEYQSTQEIISGGNVSAT